MSVTSELTVRATRPDPSPVDGGGGEPAPLPLRYALPAAGAAGIGLLLSFPRAGLWWLAPVAVALLAVAVHHRRPRAGAGLGLLCGLLFFTPLLSWTNLNTGDVPWLLLSVAESGFLALLGAAGAWLSPLVRRWPAGWPALVGLLWVGQEALRDRAPFGGFPWGRLAFSQGGSPLLRLAALGGAPLVTFAVAATGGLGALAGWRALQWWRARAAGAGPVGARRWRPVAGALAPLLLAGAVPLVGAGVPVSTPDGPAFTVAVVQGNVPRLGLDFNAQRRAVLDNHVDATLELAGQVAAGTRPRPDLVVWPENASDIDPLRNPDAAARIDEAAAAIGVPILLGAMHTDGAGRLNLGLLWSPGTGPGQRYAKRHPVPFAEYIPLRRVARLVSDKVDLVSQDMVGGSSPGVLTVGPVTIGAVICFEVAYDDLVRDTVTGGGQLLAVQTNNATFNTAEAVQQLAMVRLRAVEHGRAALMSSTVGVSAFVDADGTVVDQTRFNTRAVLVHQLRLGSGRTLATAAGPWPELVLLVLLAAALGGAGWMRRRARGRAGVRP